MSTAEKTKLCDFTSTNNDDFICTPIAPPAAKTDFYEIKPALLNLRATLNINSLLRKVWNTSLGRE